MTENLKLNEVLAAVDTGERDIWAMLNEDQQKALKKDFWNLNRYISSVKGKNRELNKDRARVSERQRQSQRQKQTQDQR
jgi:hypothetical protein